MDKAERGTILDVIEKMKVNRHIINDAEIVEKTGFSKSYVSNMLSKRHAASQNFVDRFNEVFFSKTSDLSTVNEPSEEYKVTIHEPKKGELYIMDRLLKAKDELIEQLRSQLKDKDKIIGLYEMQNPEQV